MELSYLSKSRFHYLSPNEYIYGIASDSKYVHSMVSNDYVGIGVSTENSTS